MSNTKHPNSRVVTIFRAGSILGRAQGAAVDDHFADSKQSIGSYYTSIHSHKIGNGLTFAEENILMPHVIDTPSEDREFRKKVADYFADITTNVPHGTGIQLEIGLDGDNSKEIKAHDKNGEGGNMPINLLEFIRYRHAKGHPWTAANKEESEGDQTKVWYIFDKSAVADKNSTKVAEQDAAMQIYLIKVKPDPKIVEQMLTLLGSDPREYDTPGKKEEAVREKMMKDPKKFSEVFETGELEIRYMLDMMVKTKVLKQVGTRYLDGETDKLIGNNQEETIYWFKDDDNSEVVLMLKARMQEAMQKAPEPKGSRRTQVKAKS